MSRNHMMIDIETHDTAPTAVVLSVGWTLFNEQHGLISTHHMTLRRQPQLDIGRTESKETIAWWEDQDPEVYAAALTEYWHPAEVLTELTRYWRKFDVAYAWAHSPHFDYVILDSLFRHWACSDPDQYPEEAHMVIPWTHKSWLDTRTLMFLTNTEMSKVIGKHNAAIDAENQANYVLRHLSRFNHA